MDGVIVDSMPIHTEAWRRYLLNHGIVVERLAERMHGRFNDDIVRSFFGEGLEHEIVTGHGAAKEALFRDMIADEIESRLVPGVRDFLADWPSMPKAIGSNAEAANVNHLLDKANLRGFFRGFVDGSQVANPKPKPDIYLRAAVLLGLEPRECVVFEDSAAGVEAARAAGTLVVGVETHGRLANVDLAISDFTDAALNVWIRSRATNGNSAASGGHGANSTA